MNATLCKILPASIGALVLLGNPVLPQEIHGESESSRVPDTGTSFRRGDFRPDGYVNLVDALDLLGYLFVGASPSSCMKSGDVDDNGRVDMTDAIVLVNFVVQGELPPPAPFFRCGPDVTSDEISCDSYTVCEPTEREPVPAAPSDLRLTAAWRSSFVLTWSDNSDNETAFKLEKSTVGPDGPWRETISLPADTTGVHSSRVRGCVTVWYRVRAINEYGRSAPSDVVEVAPPGGPSGRPPRGRPTHPRNP